MFISEGFVFTVNELGNSCSPLVCSSMKVPVLVSSFHSFSSSEFVFGHLLFVLVFHVGLFVFSFLYYYFFLCVCVKSRFPRSPRFLYSNMSINLCRKRALNTGIIL